jgi:hypothetical protein
VTGRNLPSTSQPKPEWPFFHREAEFRQFSGSTHGIRSANSPSFGYPITLLRYRQPRGNYGDCHWFQIFSLCDAEKIRLIAGWNNPSLWGKLGRKIIQSLGPIRGPGLKNA